mmetsp:Transcript_8927/g.31621  ORF Transcript_8927/g.31621 Transcript_8927/m.31621 type:complete len:163 (-) Transcript_8927:117-605(-)
MDTAALQGPDIFAGGHPCKIFVGNLPFSMTQDGLASLFKRHGAVIGAKMVEDRGTGKKKGFGFVTFDSEDSVAPAIARWHNADCEGRQLTVKRATARGEKPTDGAEEDADEQGAEDEGFSTEAKRGGRKGRAKDPDSFRARAEAKKQEGKVLGWGGGDEDWA